MHKDLAKKMHAVAEYIGDLNSDGKVKAQTGNEYGYAKVLSINSGMRAWVHHTLADRLIFDLMVTRVAGLKYPNVARHAEQVFDRFARDAGYEVEQRDWTHSINKEDVRQQWFFDVTNESAERICALVDEARRAFSVSAIVDTT